MPERKFINQMFAVMAIAKGLDALIINPLDKNMMANLIAAEMLAGRDSYCANYLKAFRAKQFEFKLSEVRIQNTNDGNKFAGELNEWEHLLSNGKSI